MLTTFYTLNAFTTSTYGGNPAAVVLLASAPPDDSTLQKIAANFNLPITSFIFLDTLSGINDDGKDPTVSVSLRWFTPSMEIPLCGHGTLAAAEAMFTQQGLVPANVELVAFQTRSGVVEARLLASSNRISISLKSARVEPVEPAEEERVKNLVTKAFKKDLGISFIGAAADVKPGAHRMVLVAVGEEGALEDVAVDTNVFAQLNSFSGAIVTKRSPNSSAIWDCRVFGAPIGVPEDNVTGSATCLLAPYWSQKLAVASGQEMYARQRSSRGGEMWITLHGGVLKLSGHVKLVSKGELYD